MRQCFGGALCWRRSLCLTVQRCIWAAFSSYFRTAKRTRALLAGLGPGRPRSRSARPMPAQEHDHTAVGRLVQQAAPARVVLEACQRMPEWHDVDGQARLLQAIALDADSAAVDPSYRQRLLKGLVTALQKLDVELHESLLETYLTGMSASADPSPWSVQTYEVERGQRLRLRVHKGIGGGTETGGVVWPAALVLCAWLMRQPSFCDLDVLELGAGPG